MSTSLHPEAPIPLPSRQVLESRSAQREAIDRLLALARSRVLVFDVDLAGTGWDTRVRAEGLARFLRGGRKARADMVLHQTDFLFRQCPRLIALLRHHSENLRISQAGPEARSAMDPVLVVDDQHYLHRFHASQARAELVLGDPGLARPLLDRFRAIEATAEPIPGATALGL